MSTGCVGSTRHRSSARTACSTTRSSDGCAPERATRRSPARADTRPTGVERAAIRGCQRAADLLSSMSIHAASLLGSRLVASLFMSMLVAACAGGSLSDDAYAYCVNVAPPGELDAAAEALNTAADAARSFQTNPNRGDPPFQRVCEYAYNARNRDQNAPAAQPAQPADASPTAPLDPQRSQDAGSPGQPATSASPPSS